MASRLPIGWEPVERSYHDEGKEKLLRDEIFSRPWAQKDHDGQWSTGSTRICISFHDKLVRGFGFRYALTLLDTGPRRLVGLALRVLARAM
jgi:hypothetical protein